MSKALVAKTPALELRALFDAKEKQAGPSVNVDYSLLRENAITAVAADSKLQGCTQKSVYLRCLQAGQMGLLVNSPRKLAALIPYGKECTLQIMWPGLIDMARRDGGVQLAYAEKRCANDPWRLVRGANPDLQHEIIHPSKDRGETLGYYAVFRHRDGWFDYEYMELAEIEAVRDSSAAKNSPAWENYFGEMARKTVLKRLLKRAPVSESLARAIELDNQAAMGERQDYSGAIEVTAMPVPEIEPTVSPIESGAAVEQEEPVIIS